jgi:hypothetical protein
MPYIHHPHHRDPGYANAKSQWDIPEMEELQSYTLALTNGWAGTNCLWGLHVVAAKPDFLGKSQLPANEPVKIAKFVSDDGVNWHGYPVAHWLRPFHKPPGTVLSGWIAAGLITRPSMSKIMKGKRCAP